MSGPLPSRLAWLVVFLGWGSVCPPHPPPSSDKNRSHRVFVVGISVVATKHEVELLLLLVDGQRDKE